MTPVQWPCPLPDGGTSQEYGVVFDSGETTRLLIVPALFDEGNRLRRFTMDVMRRLSAGGVASFLPDLPGTNESLQPLERQDTGGWLAATAAAAVHFRASHVLGIRGGGLFTPAGLPTWHYAPLKAASILRQMIRARILSSREAGREESREALQQAATTRGIDLAGYRFGPQFYQAFESMTPDASANLIAQDSIGGSGLWLRAEPDEDASQADALARVLLEVMAR